MKHSSMTHLLYRDTIAEDEPRCEQLRNENGALRAKMIATKEFQMAAVQEVEKLKAENNACIKRKVCVQNTIPILPHVNASFS